MGTVPIAWPEPAKMALLKSGEAWTEAPCTALAKAKHVHTRDVVRMAQCSGRAWLHDAAAAASVSAFSGLCCCWQL